MTRLLRTAIICTIFTTTVLHADYETFNIFGGIAAGFGTGGELFRSQNTTSASTEITDRFFNYGSGLKFDLGCQYFMMDKVALQGSIFYSAGVPAFKEENISAAFTQTTTYGFGMWGLRVLVVPKFQVLDLLDTYVGVGTGLCFSSRSFEITRKSTNATQNAKGSISSSPSLGFSGIFGVDYPLNDKATLFGEMGFEEISFSLSKYKVKESNIPGITGGTVVNYEKNATGTNNYPPEKVPGSNFQLHFGIRYALF